MDDLNLAYIAGFFDGEGYIGIRKNYARRGKGRQLVVQIGQGSKREYILKWIRKKFGGAIYDGLRCRRWVISGKKAEAFLLAIFPYLQAKRDEAELAFEFQKLQKPRGARRTEEEMMVEIQMGEKMKKLKL